MVFGRPSAIAVLGSTIGTRKRNIGIEMLATL
jgi:hypothetical protein